MKDYEKTIEEEAATDERARDMYVPVDTQNDPHAQSQNTAHRDDYKQTIEEAADLEERTRPHHDKYGLLTAVCTAPLFSQEQSWNLMELAVMQELCADALNNADDAND